MSAINNIDESLGPDSIYRYRTRVKCIVYSHNSPTPIDISDDIINFNSAKAIKSTGHISLALKASQNWLNIINPNDYINLYVDRGEGSGFTRLFFGYVDNLGQKQGVAENGVPTTMYSLTCSDFQKAFEKTQIYFNPVLAQRDDFRGSAIAAAAPRVAMLSAGIAITASPADFVLNVLLVLFGFGSQFTLPACYSPNIISNNRRARADFLLGQLSSDVRARVFEQGGYDAYLESLRQQQGIEQPIQTLVDPTATTASEAQQAERVRFSNQVAMTLAPPDTDSGGSHIPSQRGNFAYNALNTTLAGYPPSLLDIMDITTYLERKAIDGYNIMQLWERQGDVLSYARGVANEIVNELFFDLRLVSSGGGLVAGDQFSTDADDANGNLATPRTSTGMQYIPALVMREYPYGTISEINGDNINLNSGGYLSSSPNPPSTVLGRVPIGALFSDQPNVAGRHVVTIPNINATDLAEGNATSRAAKHLDVAVVTAGEIVNSDLSRGDGDHFNILEVLSDFSDVQASREFSVDALPLVTPSAIMRHGIRVRSLHTRSAQIVPRLVNHLQPQTQTEQEPVQQEAPPPVEPTVNPSRLPIDLVVDSAGHYAQGSVFSPYGYRYRPNTSGDTAAFNGIHGAVPEGEIIWRMHNGVDFVARTGTPVYAVRDGWVMAAALAEDIVTNSASPRYGTGRATSPFGGYGSTVIIYHPDDSSYRPSGTVPVGATFTVYAHLLSVESAYLQGSSTQGRTRFAAELRAGGRYQPVQVRAGDLIGHVGRTGVANMGAHLHFEVLVKQAHRADGTAAVWPSKDNTANPDLLTSEAQRAFPLIPASAQVFLGHPPTPPAATVGNTSQDPIPYLERWTGATVPTRGTDPDDAAATPDTAYPGDAADDSVLDPVPPAPSQEVADPTTQQEGTQQGYVSVSDIRHWLVRWALLNDHWYQHNLEYLAGSIEMRGAPEIRVGYRLDVVDWNMSFYVENVAHTWQYGQKMVTHLQVSRGQPNNPYPAYVMPSSPAFSPTDTQRATNSRLTKYFVAPDPLAVKRSINIRANSNQRNSYVDPLTVRGSTINTVDAPGESQSLSDRYHENMLEAESVFVEPAAETETNDSPLTSTSADTSTTSTHVVVLDAIRIVAGT